MEQHHPSVCKWMRRIREWEKWNNKKKKNNEENEIIQQNVLATNWKLHLSMVFSIRFDFSSLFFASSSSSVSGSMLFTTVRTTNRYMILTFCLLFLLLKRKKNHYLLYFKIFTLLFHRHETPIDVKIIFFFSSWNQFLFAMKCT